MKQEEIDALPEPHFSVESDDGATFHFCLGGECGREPYLVGVSFPFSAEFPVLFHLACVDGVGQKTEDYELHNFEEPMPQWQDFWVEFAGRGIPIYKVSKAEVDEAERQHQRDIDAAIYEPPVWEGEFEPSINPTKDWLMRGWEGL